MAGKITCMGVHAALTLTIILVTGSIAIAHEPPAPATHEAAPPAPATHDTADEVPAEKSQVEAWFQANIGHKATLEPALVAAEAGATVIKVKQDGSCQFKTIMDAINSIPAGNTKRVTVNIGGGTYNEKITIPKNKPFVTLIGSAKIMPILTFSGTAQKYGALNSATLVVEADYFIASNLVIKNDSPRPDGNGVGAQAAVALRLSGNRAAFYGCKMLGFQDTIFDDKGNHFFKDCYIEGNVDFIFGSGKSMYLSTELHVLGDAGIAGMKYITGNAKDSGAEKTGYSFIHSNITGTGTSSGALLGRAWKATVGAQIAYAFTSLGKSVRSLEMINRNKAQLDQNTALFGEYQCIGPGSSMAGAAGGAGGAGGAGAAGGAGGAGWAGGSGGAGEAGGAGGAGGAGAAGGAGGAGWAGGAGAAGWAGKTGGASAAGGVGWAGAAGGAKFTKQLTHAEAKGFISLSFIQASKWLLPPPTPLVF